MAARLETVLRQMQESGEMQNDFTEPVVYSVISYDGLTRDYTVYVEKEDPVDYFNYEDF